MEDQNKPGAGGNGKGPISSGIAPGPGEHRVDEGPASLLAATSGAGIGGSADSYPSGTGATRHTSREWRWPTSESMNRGTRSDYDSNRYASDQRSGYLSDRSRGIYYAVGAIAAGFVLQRVLQGRSTGSHRMHDRGAAQDDVYGTDTALEMDRRYGLETAYAPTAEAGQDGSMSSRYTGRMEDVKSRVSERAQRAGDEIRSRLRTTATRTRTRLNDMGDSARTQLQRAREGMGSLQEERPLLVGALGLALGAGLGAMLSVTRREKALMGDARDKVISKVKETAVKRLDTVKESAQRVADFAKQEARRTTDQIGISATGAAKPGTEDRSSADLGRS